MVNFRFLSPAFDRCSSPRTRLTLFDDSTDWCLNQLSPPACPDYGPGTLAGLEAEYTKFHSSDKSPGIITLNHESGPLPVQGFVNTYAGIKSNGWDAR